MFDSKIYKVAMNGPDDVRELERLIDSGEVAAKDVKGIMVMNEGDIFARGYTTMAYAGMLASKLGVTPAQVKGTVPIQGIAGMAGCMIPHAAIMVRREVAGKPGTQRRLVVAGGCTPDLLPEEVGTMGHLRGVRDVVKSLMKEVGITEASDVHMVFVKSSWPDEHQRAEARSRGKRTVSEVPHMLGCLSRGASALGVAVALGEVNESEISEKVFMQEQEKYFSDIAHCSSGNERTSNAVILVGNSTASVSETFIAHGRMKDSLDAQGVKQILRTMGFRFDCCPTQAQLDKIDYAFLKPKGRDTPTIRGFRHTMNTDPALAMHGWNIEKAPAHAVVASVLGTPLMEVASGSEHQGPPGVSLLAVVARA